MNSRNAIVMAQALLGGVAAAGLLAAAPAPLRAQDLRDPRAVLLQMSVNARRTGYEGRKVIIDLSRQTPDITRYQVFHLMPGLDRKDYPELGRVVMHKDGWQWSYYPQHSLIVKKRAPLSEEWDVLQEENLNLVLRNYAVRLGEGMRILGRQSLLVQFDPLEKESRPIRKIWVDMEKGLPLRGEVYGTDGNLYQITHFELLTFHSSFGHDVFEIKAPQARVIESEAEVSPCGRQGAPQPQSGTILTQPMFMPTGFVAKCLRKTTAGGGEQYQQLYTDGLSTVSFFQGGGEQDMDQHGGRTSEVAVGPATGRLHEYGLLRLIRWNNAGRHYALVGELSADELTRVARSVQPNTMK